jgi:hypothetical protein
LFANLGVPLGGFIYAASQGLQSVSCLLLQVEVLGLAGFLYSSSGLLPWQEPGRQISRTEESYPRQTSSRGDGDDRVQRRNDPMGRCVTRVNSTNVLDEGLRIGEIGHRMNSKVRLVTISVYRK